MAIPLYSLAGQTIFQIYGASGAPCNCFESYPDDPNLGDGYPLDRATRIKRTKQEYEAEQIQLRKG